LGISKRPFDNLICILLFKCIDLYVNSNVEYVVQNMPGADIDDVVSMSLLNGRIQSQYFANFSFFINEAV